MSTIIDARVSIGNRLNKNFDNIPGSASYRAVNETKLIREFVDKWESQLRKGSLELAMLAVLWEGHLYGLEILRRLESTSELTVAEGTVYPLLNRLRTLGLVESEWVESDSGHPRKYYRLTPAGRERALAMAQLWERFAASMSSLVTPLHSETTKEIP